MRETCMDTFLILRHWEGAPGQRTMFAVSRQRERCTLARPSRRNRNTTRRNVYRRMEFRPVKV